MDFAAENPLFDRENPSPFLEKMQNMVAVTPIPEIQWDDFSK
jgi:hypothetical protein